MARADLPTGTVTFLFTDVEGSTRLLRQHGAAYAETSIEVQGIAMAVAETGAPARALRLTGAVASLWESLGVSFSFPFWDALLERYIGAARAELDDLADVVWAEGARSASTTRSISP